MPIKDTTPILVGSGQYLFNQPVETADVPSPLDIAGFAARAAISDASAMPGLVSQIDTIAVVRNFIDSVAGARHPFGSSNNPPRSLANRLGANPSQLIYSSEGGQTPQRLVNEFAGRIAAGDMELALIAGAEATGIIRQAARQGIELDWHETVDDGFTDRGCSGLFTRYEASHGVTFPIQVYGLLENAWRRDKGFTLADHRAMTSRLFSGFAAVASTNPYAQFPTSRDADVLAAITPDNYWLAHPYSKWMVAQDAVNQGAAVLMCSVSKARALGIPESRWVFLHGCADVDDRYVSEREDLARSRAMSLAINGALEQAGCGARGMDFLDLYSCFPIAVLTACEAMAIATDSAPLTVTGGLPYFGGAGNNYSTHAIAEVTAKLRARPKGFGLVTANGGYLSKHSVGVYSCQSPVKPLAADSRLQAQFDASSAVPLVERAAQGGKVETYTLVHKKGQPDFGIVMGRQADGRRFIANTAAGDRHALSILAAGEPFGRELVVSHDGERNIVSFGG